MASEMKLPCPLYSGCFRYWNKGTHHLEKTFHVKQYSTNAWILVKILAVDVITHTNKIAFQIDKYHADMII